MPELIVRKWDGPYSFMIFREEGLYIARRGDNGSIQFEDPELHEVLNDVWNALTPGRTWIEKIIIKGPISFDSPLYIPSFTALEFQNKVTYTGTGYAIIVEDAEYFVIENLRLEGTADADGGILIDNSRYGLMIKCYMHGFRKTGASGLEIKAEASGEWSGLNNFYQCRFRENYNGVTLKGTVNFNVFVGCNLANNNNAGLYTTRVGSYTPHANLFYGCDFEYNDIGIDDNSDRLTVKDAWFEGNNTDFRGGNEHQSYKPYVQSAYYALPSYSFGPNLCIQGYIVDRNGRSILDLVGYPVPAGSSYLDINFPTNYSITSVNPEQKVIILPVAHWNTYVSLWNIHDTGYRLIFGSAPSSDSKVTVKVILVDD